MRTLSDREKRTIRLGAMAVGVYLVGFVLIQFTRRGDRERTEYRRLRGEATALEQRLGAYRDKATVVAELMEQFRMDPARLSRATVVSEASAAIQRAAQGGGIQLGPVRESPERGSGAEMTAMQLEGQGQVGAVLKFLHDIGGLGFPLVAESLLLTPQPGQPGQVKMNVTIVILDFDRWTAEPSRPNA